MWKIAHKGRFWNVVVIGTILGGIVVVSWYGFETNTPTPLPLPDGLIRLSMRTSALNSSSGVLQIHDEQDPHDSNSKPLPIRLAVKNPDNQQQGILLLVRLLLVGQGHDDDRMVAMSADGKLSAIGQFVYRRYVAAIIEAVGIHLSFFLRALAPIAELEAAKVIGGHNPVLR
jgi:hypothetical protein